MKLTIDSICLISSIIDKINIDEKFINEMVEMGKGAKGQSKEVTEKIQAQIGIKICLKIGTKLHEVKNDLISFISTYKGISEEEAKKVEIIEIIKELMKDEDFISFFKQKAISE